MAFVKYNFGEMKERSNKYYGYYYCRVDSDDKEYIIFNDKLQLVGIRYTLRDTKTYCKKLASEGK